MNIDSVAYSIQVAGTVAFAVTAVIAVAPKGIDLFGACVMGIITAVGGGTIRDLILGVPVFWSLDLTYIWTAVAASVVAFFGVNAFTRRHLRSLMLYFDALGIALFGTQAVSKTWDLGFGLLAAPVLLGIITAIGGGLLRDVLAGRQTLLMSREIYAVPVLLGTLVFVAILELMPEHRDVGALVCFSLIFALRAAAIRWSLTMPDWLTTKQSQ